MDKYLRNDDEDQNINDNKVRIPQPQKNFLLRKKQEDEIEEEYNKFLKRNYDDDSLDEQNIEELINEKKYIMKEEMNNNTNNNTYEKFNRKMKPLDLESHLEIAELNDSPTMDRLISNKNEENLFSVIHSKDEEEMNNNYVNFENIYMNEGKIKKNVEDNMFTANKEENLSGAVNPNNSPVKKQTIMIPTLTSGELNFTGEMYNKNEFKLRCLQDKIEDKIRTEYETKIRQKEKELELRTKTEFEEAVKKIKSEVEKKSEEEKRLIEEKSQNEWQDKYEEILLECKSKLRDDKEKKLAMNMYHKLKPSVEKEIYKNEYNKLEEKIRKEFEQKIGKEVEKKKAEEVEKLKRKLEYFTKTKIEEMEENLKSKCKEDLEAEMKKELERKEKDLKINYLRKFEYLKNNLEKQLKDEYQSKEKELSKEINEIKSKVYRQKCAENIKLNKIKTIKKTLENKEKRHFENAEKLEKALQMNNNKNMDSKSFYSERNNPTNSKFVSINPASEVYYLDEEDDSPSVKMEKANQENRPQDMTNNINSITNLIANSNVQSPMNQQINKAVNLLELNKRLKSSTSMTMAMNSSDIISLPNNKKELSIITNNFANASSTKYQQEISNEKIPSNNSKMFIQPRPLEDIRTINTSPCKNGNQQSKLHTENYRLDSPKKLTEVNQSQNKYVVTNSTKTGNNFNDPIDKIYLNNDKEESPTIKNCLSLRLNANIPITLHEFGKFLVKYIENEENYRILFDKEFRKFKTKIKKIFDDDKTSDHCLLDYMVELWEKIEVSYSNRYKILVELSKGKSQEIYHFLDKETEYLTEYFQKSQELFGVIKNREKMKTKLQSKANKNELTSDDKDKFNYLTAEVGKQIRNFKNKNAFNLIWKGLHYEWVSLLIYFQLINYENWFYENNK